MQKKDGMMYAPVGKTEHVCAPGEFPIAVIGLDHGHIYGMCNGLIEAGADLCSVWDPDPDKMEAFQKIYGQVKCVSDKQQILDDKSIRLVASASIPSSRCGLGLEVLEHDKDYFSDKAPMTSLDQLEIARAKVAETQGKYSVYYSERLHTESSVYAGYLIEQGAIGRVLQVIGMGPHRLNVESRPDWFFKKELYGGIICDLGCHQVEQFLHFAGASDATVTSSQVANYDNKQYPELEDFGDVSLVADNGATNYFRVDWFTPNGLSAWGDGRTFILGTEGYIELRKYLDIARDAELDHVYLVNREGERHISARGTVGYPFFAQLIRDCLDRTEISMSQEHTFKAIEIALRAQRDARKVE